MTSYDEVPYRGGTRRATHPNWMGAIARLHGLVPASPASARVLEIGCGDGANLIPMAEATPCAAFLGLDVSATAIARGQAIISEYGLTNIELRHQDVLAFQAARGAFDYIIVNGIFSWVPESVREKILAVVSAGLSPHGVAFINYNALPGWQAKRVVRDILLFYTKKFDRAAEKIRAGRACLDLLAQTMVDGAHDRSTKRVINELKRTSDALLYHEYLAEENTAYYVSDFLELASKHGLQYLSDARGPRITPDKLALAASKFSAADRMQYMDFLQNRAFRQTLLCLATTSIQLDVSDGMQHLAVRAKFKSTAKIDLADGTPASFVSEDGRTLLAVRALPKATFHLLSSARHHALSFKDIIRAVEALIAHIRREHPEGLSQTIKNDITILYQNGFVDVYAEPLDPPPQLSAKPFLSGSIRTAARRGRITNGLHESFRVDEDFYAIISEFDGTKTPEEVIDRLVAKRSGNTNFPSSSSARSADEKARINFATQVYDAIRFLVERGFFADGHPQQEFD